jgi:hypothetical protein
MKNKHKKTNTYQKKSKQKNMKNIYILLKVLKCKCSNTLDIEIESSRWCYYVLKLRKLMPCGTLQGYFTSFIYRRTLTQKVLLSIVQEYTHVKRHYIVKLFRLFVC